ncbi:MAG: hypothetical protein KF687_03815 [Cyclobacteriaceae bacterium]|nr:hypothetical protein [Cyclobacteriaceae bacterium]
MRGQEKTLWVVVLIFAVQFTVYSQTQDSYEYQSEFTWGINKNTSSGLIGGFTFKKARKINDRVFETFGLEIMNVKHPQEIRRNSIITGNFFILGKNNYLYSFRFQYGRDVILYKKAPYQGVEIKGVFALGPSLGIIAPYYVEYSPDGGFRTFREQYHLGIPPDQIWGTGYLFQGLGESGAAIGGNFKAALNFETGTVKSSVLGFEVGTLLDAYTKPIELMPSTVKYSVFPTLFITVFFGSRK